ncbi:GDSL-type esterase/lipase family protein [Propionibacteriaceae bacterium G1746]
MPVSRRQLGLATGAAALMAVGAGVSWQVAGHASAQNAVTSSSRTSGPSTGPTWTTPNPTSTPTARPTGLAHGARVLFQGDSITDVNRSRVDDGPNTRASLGAGYAWLAASSCLVARPTQGLEFFNRGISGNTVADLAARWQRDTVALAPDVVSLLIGVNDYWNRHRVLGYKGSPEKSHREVDALVASTLEALPGVRIVMCEPFLLVAGPVKESWQHDFAGYRQAAADIALARGLAFVGFQSVLDLACELAPAREWLHDGIHPTTSAAALMAREWVRVVGA